MGTRFVYEVFRFQNRYIWIYWGLCLCREQRLLQQKNVYGDCLSSGGDLGNRVAVAEHHGGHEVVLGDLFYTNHKFVWCCRGPLCNMVVFQIAGADSHSRFWNFYGSIQRSQVADVVKGAEVR